jgi:hypothetical protein
MQLIESIAHSEPTGPLGFCIWQIVGQLRVHLPLNAWESLLLAERVLHFGGGVIHMLVLGHVTPLLGICNY